MKHLSFINDKKLWRQFIEKRKPLKSTSFNSIDTNSIQEVIRYLLDEDIAAVHSSEGMLLYDYASNTHGIIVEIGTCRAGSTIILGLADRENEGSRVHSVDIIQINDNYKRLKQFGLNCHLIESDSHSYGEQWDKGPIGMLFIDGNHSTPFVYKDMDIWGRHLVVGGHMLLHDCLRPRQIKRFRKRGRLKKDGKISHSLNDLVNVHNAVVDFLRTHPNFKEIRMCKSIKVLKKTGQ